MNVNPDGSTGLFNQEECPASDPSVLDEMDSSAKVEGTVRIGRYDLIEEIGRGGMGRVFRGFDHEMQREVAVKSLRTRFLRDEAVRKQFIDEARLAGRLQHPNLVPVYDLNSLQSGRPFFTMRLVRGETLAEALKKRTNNSDQLPMLLKGFEQVCHAVAYVHSCNVLHLDIKPSNVMLGEYGEVRLMDWGLARSIAPGTAVEQMTQFGTPGYIAPELVLEPEKPLDYRLDVFALGSMLCEILTGRAAYSIDQLPGLWTELLGSFLEEAQQRLATCHAEPRLVRLAQRCIKMEPRERPSNAEMVACEISSYLESQLRQTEQDFVRFFELSPDLFCIADFSGFFLRVNANFTRLLGYSQQELVSRPFTDFVHPDDLAATMSEISNLRIGHPTIKFSNRYRDSQGNYHWLDWHAKPYVKEGLIYAVARSDETVSLEL